jgi:octopine/nopaline transport system permease protein
MDFSLALAYLPDLLRAALTTLGLVATSLALGIVMAAGIAAMRLSANPWIKGPASFYIFCFRGTPLLVQIFIIYYGFGQFEFIRQSIAWVVLKDAWWCAVIALMMNTAAYSAEIVRGGIESVPYGQLEAAKACGMSPVKRFLRITAPQALAQALPAYGNEMILMVKASSLASVITVVELTRVARTMQSKTFDPYTPFLTAGLIYLIINFAITRFIKAAEWKVTPYQRPPSGGSAPAKAAPAAAD